MIIFFYISTRIAIRGLLVKDASFVVPDDHYRIIEGSGEAVFVLNSSRYVYVNKAACCLLGYESAEELVRSTPLDRVAPEHRERISRYIVNRRTGIATPEDYVVNLLRKDGTSVTVETHISTLKLHGEIFSVAFSHDITDQVEYNNRLGSLHVYGSKLSKAVSYEEIADIVCESVKMVFGHPYCDFNVVLGSYLVPCNLVDDTLHQSLELHTDGPGIVVRAYQTGKSQLVHDTRKDMDYVSGRGATDVWLSELAVPVKIEDEVVAVINIEARSLNAFTENDEKLVETLALHVASAMCRIRSQELQNNLYKQVVEERLKKEQAVKTEAIKTRLISSAAHEIRTPLTIIQGYIELSKIEPFSQTDVIKYLDIIERNINRLKSLTDDLIEIQAIEAETIQLDFETVKLDSLLDDIRYEYVPLLNSKQQQLIIDDGGLGDLEVRCDKHRILQVVFNLLSNASMYSNESSSISLCASTDGSMVSVAVSDQGIGLSEEDVSRLFFPFPDINKGTHYEGSGLGLSICRGIIKLHDGTICAESQGRGKGSTFKFYIPIENS